MENLDWLEWECTSNFIDFQLNQHGTFPPYIDRVKLSRSSDLKLLAHGKGTGSLELCESTQLRAGEVVSDSEETTGITEFGESIKLKGVQIVSKQLIGNNFANAFIDAEVYEVEVFQNEAPIITHIEWIANFRLDPYIFSRTTTRQWSVFFNRDRHGKYIFQRDLKKDLSISRDHFCCECTVDGKNWSLTVGEVSKEIASVECLPGFIEFSAIDDCLPLENTKQIILAALSFTIGRQLVSVGTTSLAQDGDRVSYTARTVNLVGEETSYTQPNRPPIPLDSSKKEKFLDENKVSTIISAVATKMKDLNIEHSLRLVWLSEASPLNVKAAHLGAAIESLRNSYCTGTSTIETTLIPKNLWKKIEKCLLNSFENYTADLDMGIRESNNMQILKRKLAQLNDKSSNMKYEEFFDLISLKIGKVELRALQERNKPAHGHCYSSDQYNALVMTTDALYTLFNKIVLKLTNASDHYIDYSAYGHPVRHINDPLGGPEGDGSPAKV